VAEKELADRIAVDRRSRREIVLDEDAARGNEGEDRLPVERTAAVREHEPERPATAQQLVAVALQQLDVADARQTSSRRLRAVGIELHRDDAAGSLRHR